MSEKRIKRARQLAYDAELGHYLPGQMASKAEFEKLDLSSRQRNKRIPDMVARKGLKRYETSKRQGYEE